MKKKSSKSLKMWSLFCFFWSWQLREVFSSWLQVSGSVLMVKGFLWLQFLVGRYEVREGDDGRWGGGGTWQIGVRGSCSSFWKPWGAFGGRMAGFEDGSNLSMVFKFLLSPSLRLLSSSQNFILLSRSMAADTLSSCRITMRLS